MSVRQTYVRPMAGWWRRDRHFAAYMAREATAILVYLYGLALVAGLVALAKGRAAFDAWLALLSHPLGILFQLVALAAFAYHTWSWFRIMPKTMPPVAVAGKRLDASAITAGGLIVAGVTTVAIVFLAAAAR